MGAVNLGTMFAPTVLRQRPKFQVANMMEFMDNKGQTKVVELLIDRVFQVFGSSEQYDPIKLITAHITSNDDKTTIADYNRMNSARGSISLANCERSKSTCSTVIGNNICFTANSTYRNGQHSISPSTIASSITTSKLFHSSDKQNAPNTSSTDSNTNTALSSLIIGRRKPIGRLLALHQTTEASDNVSPVNPTNLDQYSFIDNDLPGKSKQP
ncbi:unnamed protein product [Schistosoma curassoni]|uniref:Rho-GAP domain-containing protein n=1 Tax=Schistosoma curassoni TaxID=6186 RepID=A0A183KC31_9TREM|nr:unnamed protein product [Schistosoma curassoni]